MCDDKCMSFFKCDDLCMCDAHLVMCVGDCICDLMYAYVVICDIKCICVVCDGKWMSCYVCL